MKPIPLLAYPIMNSSMSNSVVLDPFGGSGSTLIACEQTDRICYTVELDEKFCDVIVKRYIEQVGGSDGVAVQRDGLTYKYSEVEVQHEYSGKSVLSAKLVCEDCGAFFGPKVWHSTDQYRRTIWQCNGKFANEERCHTPVVDTETIQRLFIKAYNLMMQDRVQIIKQCEAWRARLMDFGTLDADIDRQLEETQVVAELVKAAVKENASTAQSQEAYLKKYEALTERYEKAAAELERLQSLRTARSQQDKKMALYIRTLKKQPEVMHDWNDTIWTG